MRPPAPTRRWTIPRSQRPETPRRPRRAFAALALTAVLAGPAVAACSGGDAAETPVAASSSSGSRYEGTTAPPNMRLPTGDFTDETGDSYDVPKHAKGRFSLVFMGYTHCPDICPTTLADLAAVAETLSPAEREKVDVVFITADPKRDTPKVLHHWLSQFGHPSFVGLTASQATIDRTAEGLHVPLGTASPDAHGNYQVQHGSAVFLFGPEGKARLIYTKADSEAITHDLKLLIKGAR